MEKQEKVVGVTGFHHVAITVRDVGISTSFYADVLGLQQVNRPDFNRYGAWFDVGNMQLHLIKGEPCVPSGGSLIIPHLALEVRDPEALFSALKKNNIRVDINELKCNKEDPSDAETLIQYFIRDPDGYFLELCNCSVLNTFCFDGYKEGIPDNKSETNQPSLAVLTRFIRKVVQAKKFTLPSHEDLLKNTIPAEKESEEKVEKLLHRRRVYGDICQGFSEDDLREVLRQSGDHIPTAILLMRHSAKKDVKIPPKFQTYDPETGRETTIQPSAVVFTGDTKPTQD